ncbi:hypothetical protein RDWZM_001404 [Blomia tropicalis]|uniref:HTH psq-type domain-containing protein n=1 Tax=Blomia tropicalis TaxID=40697 RepID=A0A9Q0MCD2_BLOTA|nr:hypothetical protein RDWZM_001404 [Blomia tropicalis]
MAKTMATTITYSGSQNKIPNGTIVIGPTTSSASSSPGSTSSSPSPLSSSCPSPIMNQTISIGEMQSAIDELRRENDRILAELANTQEVLDLFENYRSLIKEHMNMCICSGRDYQLGKWKKYENEYRKLLPIKRIIEPSAMANILLSSDFGCKTKFQNYELTKQKVSPESSLMKNLTKTTAKPIDITCRPILSVNKSKIRSYLDTIIPFESNNHDQSTTQQSIPSLVDQQQLMRQSAGFNAAHSNSEINFIHKGNQIIIRKRMAPPDLMSNHVADTDDNGNSLTVSVISNSKLDKSNLSNQTNEIVIKKTKLANTITNSINPRQKYTILKADNKFTPSSQNRHVVCQSQVLTEKPDQEEQRLDQLNNALDQILMGRLDALNQLHTSSTISTTTTTVNTNTTITSINASLKPSSITTTTTSTLSILGAALESGFKPYPSYHQQQIDSGKSSVNQPQPQHSSQQMKYATIKLFQPNQNQSSMTTSSSTATPITVAIQTGANNSMGNNSSLGSNITVINNKTLFQKRPHLSNEERMDIINRLKKNESGARIARDYGITKQAVSAIKRRAQLMGDNFINPNTFISSLENNNFQQQQRLNSVVGGNGGSKLSINLSSSNSGSPVDNSLVSRQLKQQKVNATVLRQTNILSTYPRSTSNLCLPVNPVAILKSQMAKQGQSSSNPGSGASTPTGEASSPASSINKLKIDSKRLLLPRLLQGTETYQSYAFKNPSDELEIRKKIKSENNRDVDSQLFSIKIKQNDSEQDDEDDENVEENQLEPHDSFDEEEVIYSRENDQQVTITIPPNNDILLSQSNGNDEDGTESQDYNNSVNTFDPNDLMDLGEFVNQQLNDDVNREDINNNPDISMSMFGVMPMINDEEEEEEEEEEEVGRFNGQNSEDEDDSLLMNSLSKNIMN